MRVEARDCHTIPVSDSDSAWICGLSTFNTLTPDDCVRFLSNGSVSHYTRNDQLFLHGDKVACFYIVKEGWIKLYRDSMDGCEAVLDIVSSGQFFGDLEASLKSENVRFMPYSAQVVSDKATVISLPIHGLKEKLRENGNLAYAMCLALSRQTNGLRSQVEQLTVMNAEQRVVSFLLKLKKEHQNSVHLPYSKTLAANHLGMKPETFSRVLNQLRKYGIIIEGTSIRFDNDDWLQQYAEISNDFSFSPGDAPHFGG